MNRKNIFIWSLYDFANSFIFITFLVYFSKWLVVGQGLSDGWYNAIFIFGSIALLFLAPWFGARADQYSRGRSYLAASTLGCFVFYGLAILAAIYHTSIFWPALLFGIGNFFYQLSFAFYNPLLNNLASPERQGRVSGFGFLGNYLGQMGGILMSLPFVSGKILLGSIESIIAPLILALFIFGLLSLPLLLKREIFVSQTNGPARKSSLKPLSLLMAAPGLILFLIAFFFLSDTITTAVNNFSIFTSSVFGASNQHIGLLTLLILVFASLGALIWGWLSDRLGPQRVLVRVLSILSLVIPGVAWAPNYSFYIICSLMVGFCIGGTWSIARRLLISLVPSGMINYAFGIYAVIERAATIIGPLTWIAVLSVGGYRWAMFSMTIFAALAAFLMSRIPNKN